MSQRTNLNTPQHQQSLDGSQFFRSPAKNTSVISQMSINPNDYLRQQFIRNPNTQKHRTFNGVNLSPNNSKRKTYEPQRYYLSTMSEKKMFMALALVEKFITTYEQQKIIYDENNKKVHENRKKAFLLNSSSQFKTIQPISHQQLNLQESYQFLVKFRNQLKSFFRQSFISEIKKRRDKLSLIYKQEKLQSIEETEKESIRQSSFKNLQPMTTFITADFNGTSLSENFPQVDLMGVGFPENINGQLKNNSHNNKTMNITTKLAPKKFTPLLKLPHSKSRLHIHPSKNKYQSRKKQQIRLFLQLDQKTQHLQNFRSQQGKFFKFNQNLKLTVKNINMCRIVLLSKKTAIMQQFARLGDDCFYRQMNERIGVIERGIRDKQSKDSSLPKKENSINNSSASPKAYNHDPQQQINIKITQMTHQRYPSQTIPHAQFPNIPFHHACTTSSQSQPPNSYKQKALRIKNYIQQTTKYFAQLQSFLLQFLKTDKNYQNYKKQNSLKQKLTNYHPITQKQNFYRQFLDKCFHVSQISRLYFNALNQFAHQNINLKELKLLNKSQLEKENKRLIQLRYALIYMQKECENTTEGTFFTKTFGENMLGKVSKGGVSGQCVEQWPSARSIASTSQPNMRNLLCHKDLVQTTIKSVLKQTHNTLQLPTSPQQNNQHKPSSNTQIKSVTKLIPVQSPLERQYPITTGIKRQSRQRQPRVSTNLVKQEQPDINLIWKTFYDKKFSSKAIRIRLY